MVVGKDVRVVGDDEGGRCRVCVGSVEFVVGCRWVGVLRVGEEGEGVEERWEWVVVEM